MHNSKKGFTLAEVLVTLAIIGVVAALTIPTLIQSTNSSRYQTSLKKALSVLNQALTTEVADGRDASSASGASVAAATTALRELFAENLNVVATQGNTIWLADGSKISFVNPLATGCDSIADPGDFDATANCYAIVDVNGDKGPNDEATAASAADVYILGISKNSVLPITTAAGDITLPAAFVRTAADTEITGSDAYPTTMFNANNASIAAVTGQ